MIERWRCTFGDRLDRCPEPRTLLPDNGHPELCWYHAKVAAGLFGCDAQTLYGCMLAEGHKGQHTAIQPERRTMTPDAWTTDEFLELERLVRREGDKVRVLDRQGA